MSIDVRSYVRVIGAGFAAASVLVGLMFVGRLSLGVPLVPELLAEILFAHVPLSVFALTLGLLGAWAKPAAFVALVSFYVALLTFWGGGTLRWVETRRPSRPWLAAWLSAVLLYALTVGGLFDQLTAGEGGVLFSLGSLLLLHSIYGFGLALLARWQAARPSPGRREAVRSVLAAVAIVSVSRLLSRLGELGVAAAATIGDLLQKVRGLPAEVTPVGRFYTVSKNVFDPAVDAKTWRLEIKGLVERPYALTHDDLRSLPAVQQYATLECISNEVGGNLISNALWKGVRLRDLLSRAGIKPGASELILRARDGYSDSFPLKKALAEGTMLAWEMNGAPLARQHGFPARVIVPGIYGMKNVKWLGELEVADYDYKGYWEVRGWSDEAIYKTMSRIDAPAGGQLDPANPYLGGIAFAGDRGVKAVEVSWDGGKTWRAAMVKPALSSYTWVLWALEWNPATEFPPGSHTVQVRAVDGTGAVQTAEVRPPLPDGASGYHALRVSRRAAR